MIGYWADKRPFLTGRGKYLPLILSTLLSAAGYVGESKSQTTQVIRAICLGTGIIPAAILLVGIALLILLPINHKQELAIQAAIERKHGKESGLR